MFDDIILVDFLVEKRREKERLKTIKFFAVKISNPLKDKTRT